MLAMALLPAFLLDWLYPLYGGPFYESIGVSLVALILLVRANVHKRRMALGLRLGGRYGRMCFYSEWNGGCMKTNLEALMM